MRYGPTEVRLMHPRAQAYLTEHPAFAQPRRLNDKIESIIGQPLGREQRVPILKNVRGILTPCSTSKHEDCPHQAGPFLCGCDCHTMEAA
jgi:hypothetical protein